jgi:hypothetical protein
MQLINGSLPVTDRFIAAFIFKTWYPTSWFGVGLAVSMVSASALGLSCLLLLLTSWLPVLLVKK